MRGDAAGDGFQPQRSLMADERKVRGRFGDDDCTWIDADLGPVRHRVDVQAALYGADVQRRLAHDFVAGDVEVKILQLADRSGRLVDGVNAELRHRSMRSDAAGDGFQPQRPLMADERKVRGRFGDDDCACVPEDIAKPGLNAL